MGSAGTSPGDILGAASWQRADCVEEGGGIGCTIVSKSVYLIHMNVSDMIYLIVLP